MAAAFNDLLPGIGREVILVLLIVILIQDPILRSIDTEYSEISLRQVCDRVGSQEDQSPVLCSVGGQIIRCHRCTQGVSCQIPVFNEGVLFCDPFGCSLIQNRQIQRHSDQRAHNALLRTFSEQGGVGFKLDQAAGIKYKTCFRFFRFKEEQVIGFIVNICFLAASCIAGFGLIAQRLEGLLVCRMGIAHAYQEYRYMKDDEHGNQDAELPFFCFVMEGQHAQQRPGSSTCKGQAQQDFFGNPPGSSSCL